MLHCFQCGSDKLNNRSGERRNYSERCEGCSVGWRPHCLFPWIPTLRTFIGAASQFSVGVLINCHVSSVSPEETNQTWAFCGATSRTHRSFEATRGPPQTRLGILAHLLTRVCVCDVCSSFPAVSGCILPLSPEPSVIHDALGFLQQHSLLASPHGSQRYD